jgi:hypothetical protein
MRAVHGDKKQNNLELNEAGTNTGTRFSWDNSAKELVNGL